MKDAAQERGPASIPELSSGGLAQALEMGLGIGGQKESVEWVNMVLHKIWKVYRRSLEAWLVGLLQPAIDTLPLPSVVRRVEIAEFSLDFEPLSVRNVQRRASRRANDLQYEKTPPLFQHQEKGLGHKLLPCLPRTCILVRI